MLQALVHRYTPFGPRTLPAAGRLRRAVDAARPALRVALFGALVALFAAAVASAVLYAAVSLQGTASLLATWLAGTALAAATPHVAARTVGALLE